MCPTFLENKTYQEWKYLKDPDVFAVPCDHDHVETALESILGFAKGTNSLKVLDDCASSQDGEKQNQRVGKTCLPRKAHRNFHDSSNTAAHEHCETLQDECLQGGVLLHRPQGRRQGYFRKLKKGRGEKDYGNSEEREVRPVGDSEGVSVHAQSRVP